MTTRRATGPGARAALVLLTAASLAGCAVNIHGDDPAGIPSETAVEPDAAHLDVVERARSDVRAFVEEENLPGLSLAVGVAGEVAWVEAFGWADLAEGRPMTPSTRLRIGGVAKPMTATAVGRLHERGLVDLDAPVGTAAPELPETVAALTLRALMGHVAGVRHYEDDEELLYRREHCAGPLDGVAWFADDQLRFDRGMRFAYSSYGWTVVGAVVAAAAGEPFLEVLHREVFDPLGMSDTVFDDARQPPDRRASLYFPTLDRETRHGVEWANDGDISCLQGGDALLSTPTDLVRFGLGTLDGRPLRSETLEMLQTPLTLASGESTGYGLGWSVRTAPFGPEPETTLLGHGGSTGGGSTSFLTVPARGIVVAVATNVSYADPLPSLSLRLARLFAGVEPSGVDPSVTVTQPGEFVPPPW